MANNFKNIPLELRERVQWICWREANRGGRVVKLPVDPKTGLLASLFDATTWATFEEACLRAPQHGGIGFVFAESDPYVGIDMFDAENIETDAQYIGSYCERTVSGRGAHAICRGVAPTTGRHGDDTHEIYGKQSYFAMTGDVIGIECEIRDAQAAIDDFCAVMRSVPIDGVPKRRRSADLAPWRDITTADVEAAIDGSILSEVIEVMRSPCAIPLPFEIGIAKALPFMGACLSGQLDDMPAIVAESRRGIDRARIKIATAQGQACNIWCLLVAQSGAGKDIGGLVPRVLGGDRKLLIGSAGSEEGIADALCERGNGLISISEFRNWVDRNHWQHKAASFLTGAFNEGSFCHQMSKRGKDSASRREAPYCYPNIAANCQPETLLQIAKTQDITTGFLGRFIVVSVDARDWIAYPKSGYDAIHHARWLGRIADELQALQGVVGVGGDFYARRLNDMFLAGKAPLKPLWVRLTAEYLPRIALMLAIRHNERLPDQISADAMQRAEMVCQWLYAHAERALGGIGDSEAQVRFEGLIGRLMEMVRAAGEAGLTGAALNHQFGRGTRAKERSEVIEEAESRGLVSVERRGRLLVVKAS